VFILLQDEKNEMLHTNTWLTYVSISLTFAHTDSAFVFAIEKKTDPRMPVPFHWQYICKYFYDIFLPKSKVQQHKIG